MAEIGKPIRKIRVVPERVAPKPESEPRKKPIEQPVPKEPAKTK